METIETTDFYIDKYLDAGYTIVEYYYSEEQERIWIIQKPLEKINYLQMNTIQTTKAIVTKDCAILIINQKVLDTIEEYLNLSGAGRDEITIMTHMIGSHWGYEFYDYLELGQIDDLDEDTHNTLVEAQEMLLENEPNNKFKLIVLETFFDLVWNSEDTSGYEVSWRFLNHCLWLTNCLYTKALEVINNDSEDKFYN